MGTLWADAIGESRAPRSAGCRGTFALSADYTATISLCPRAETRLCMLARSRSWNRTAPRNLGAAIGANGGSLADRIGRLLGRQRPAVRTGLGPGVLAVAILLVAAIYGLFSASPTRVPRSRWPRSDQMLVTGANASSTRWVKDISLAEPQAGDRRRGVRECGGSSDRTRT
jgi:hypothetical protein